MHFHANGNAPSCRPLIYKTGRFLSRFPSLDRIPDLCSMSPLFVYLMSMQLRGNTFGQISRCQRPCLKQISSLVTLQPDLLYFHALNALANVQFTHQILAILTQNNKPGCRLGCFMLSRYPGQGSAR